MTQPIFITNARNSINVSVGKSTSELNFNLLYSFILLIEVLIELLEVILFSISFHNISKTLIIF